MDRRNTTDRFATGCGYASIAAAHARNAGAQFACAGATARARRLAELAAQLDNLARRELDATAGAVPPAGPTR